LKEAMDAAHGHEHNDDGSEKTKDQKNVSPSAGHDDHASVPHGISMREMFFMASTGILALLLVITSLRRRSPDFATTELS
jgi:hypothetical protein